VITGELLGEAMSLKELLRSTHASELGGETLRLFQEKVSFRRAGFGEHGADFASLFIAGNLSLSSELSALAVDFVLFIPFGVVHGIIKANFFRNFLASKSMLFAN